MKCSNCPVEAGPCLGERAARLCELAATRPDYRRLLVERTRDLAAQDQARTPTLPELLAAVTSCAHRGPVLPHSLQPPCGCGELAECRDGRGTYRGRVTLPDCLSCVSARPACTTPDAISAPPPAGLSGPA